MGTHKYKYNWEFFDTESEKLYYILGFIAADGYISKDSIEIGLSEKDIRLLEEIRDMIVPHKPIYIKEKTNSVMLKIGCKHLVPKFKEYFGMKTSKKHNEIKFPKVPKMYIKDFIRGYIDGDGTIDTTKGYREDKVYVGPRLRILGNKDFLASLNEETKKHYSHKTNSILRKSKENVFIITYNFSTARKILKWLYLDSKIRLERKYDKFLEVCELKI